MTTDITELAQSMKRRATSANEFGESLYVKGDDVLALVEALEKSEKTSEARREAIDRTHNMFVRERDRANAAEEALEKAQTINAAAEKLVRCKGRYHSEQNYRALAALFGATTPDLPPLDEESRTVTVKMPKPHAHLIWIQAGHAPDDYWDDVAVSHSEKDRCCDGSERYPVYARWEIEEMLTAAGIKVEAE